MFFCQKERSFMTRIFQGPCPGTELFTAASSTPTSMVPILVFVGSHNNSPVLPKPAPKNEITESTLHPRQPWARRAREQLDKQLQGVV